ncbi:MAG: flagellar hook-basal body complex protein FliE [Terracidiphilus sp.]|jgi:flagellar hook-basal body complex protein FliE
MSSPISSLGSIGSISELPKLASLQPTSNDEGGGFGSVLKSALDQVNVLNGGAQQQIGSLLKGGNSDMSSVMVAVEKADVAFALMMQVRNKIVSAYQDIEKMQF